LFMFDFSGCKRCGAIENDCYALASKNKINTIASIKPTPPL